jgi:hypothetical protein
MEKVADFRIFPQGLDGLEAVQLLDALGHHDVHLAVGTHQLLQ